MVQANQAVARDNDEVVTQGALAAIVATALAELMPQMVIGQANYAKIQCRPMTRKGEVAADPGIKPAPREAVLHHETEQAVHRRCHRTVYTLGRKGAPCAQTLEVWGDDKE